MINDYLENNFEISKEVIEFVNNSEKELIDIFQNEELIRDYNILKVLSAMNNAKLSSIHFNGSTGYGYGDIARDKVEEIYKHLFKTEDALVRPNIVSGTHAIFLGLSTLLKFGDTFVSIAGPLYDTMQKAIGITGNEKNTLISRGVRYEEIDLINNDFDIPSILKILDKKPKLLMIQRSTGYSERNAICMEQIENVIIEIRKKDSNVIIFVDNCYGEFTEEKEPSEVGADIIVGSLIKNLGAGIALTGGYLAGKKELIETVADYLTAPGLGKELGISFDTARTTLQGLYYAPGAVCEAKKTARLFANVYEKLGYKVFPKKDEKRSDIVESIVLGSEEAIVSFCKSIQSSSCVDSFVSPEPWDMPGYENKVVMASGSFIDGSSIELSADGPIREPYIVYFQGGLTFSQGRLAVMKSVQNLINDKLLKFQC